MDYRHEDEVFGVVHRTQAAAHLAKMRKTNSPLDYFNAYNEFLSMYGNPNGKDESLYEQGRRLAALSPQFRGLAQTDLYLTKIVSRSSGQRRETTQDIRRQILTLMGELQNFEGALTDQEIAFAREELQAWRDYLEPTPVCSAQF